MGCFPFGKKATAGAKEEEADNDGEETKKQKTDKEIAGANLKLKGAEKHTDAWTKELGDAPTAGDKEFTEFSAQTKLSGHHAVVFAGKDRYAGEFKNSQFHGLGIHTFPDGEVYDGEWRQGMQHGIGHKYWPDGTKFKGFYRLDARNGLGVCLYADGTRYCGMWINNLYDGVGKLEWPDESMHPGSFSVMAGVGGTPVIVHGKTFMGHFLEGKKHGIGHHIFHDGSYYKGEYENGVYHGEGIFQFANGDVYEGEWQRGAFHGQGKLWCGWQTEIAKGQNREGYVGLFANGARHGKGVLYFRNGGRFEGDFNEGARKGEGLHVFPDGRTITAEWWKYRDARDSLPSNIRDTLLLTHTMTEEAIFKLMFNEELPPPQDD